MAFLLVLFYLIIVRRANTTSTCDTASVFADCDNLLYVYLKQANGNLKLLGTDHDWHNHLDLTISNITSSTIIEFKCVDEGVIGGFIATIEFNGILYSTTNPLSKSHFNLISDSKGDTTNLVYHDKTASPWSLHTSVISDEAKWVWNNYVHNTMTFDFNFGNIISSTTNTSSHFICGCNEECVINCDAIDARHGCSNTVIDGRLSSSLNITCLSSNNHYYGGCQFSTIYCPIGKDAQCNIYCNDYYGCYMTNIYATYQHISDNNVNIECMDEEGSCLKTQLYANKSTNVNISCYGSGILGSRTHSSCDNFNIHIEELSGNFNLLCFDDYSCFNMYIYGNAANYLSIVARGDMALSTSYIYAENAGYLDLFCGSEESEYGCFKLYIFNPIYSSPGYPKTNINCQGHGCYDEMYFYSNNGALDLDISLNGCGECNDISECISSWYFYCNDLTLFDNFHGDLCDSIHCNCDYGINQMKSNWMNTINNKQCNIFIFDYECEAGIDCIVNCMEQWPLNHGCFDKVINGKDANSLTVICNSTDSIYGACESTHIYCPNTDNSQCNVECDNKDACYDTEITVVNDKNSKLNLKCKNGDSCSHTNVYGTYNNDISIDCIATDSCDNINVTSNNADNITIHCEGSASLSSYATCNGFNVFATNVTNEIKLICKGDYACYQIDVFGGNANKIVVDSVGNYASYGGNIFAVNSKSMFIACKSQYNEYGCYKMGFYIPEHATTLQCEGHGCYLLELYAPNGYTDLISLQISGCGECPDVVSCINNWYMHCGNDYLLENSWSSTRGAVNPICRNKNGNCECNDNGFHTLFTNSWIDDNGECDLSIPDYSCTDNEKCIVDCTAANPCENNIIMGNNATSLTVNCGNNGCNKAKIYCPKRFHSECNIICDEEESCASASVYVSDIFKANVNCTEYSSCNSITLYGDDANDITMNCYGKYSYSIFNDSNYYDYYNTYYYWYNYDDYATMDAVCDQITINAKRAQYVTLNCFGYSVCYSANIDVNTAGNVFINALGDYSIYNGWVDAKYILHKLHLNFKSKSGDKYGVENFMIYLPSNDKTYLNCAGYGCQNLNFYAANGMNDINNISFFGCSNCIKPEACISDWNLYCGRSYSVSTTFTGTYCEENNCDCDDLKGQIEESFHLGIESIEDTSNNRCDKNDTINPDFTCTANQHCVIDCGLNDCTNKLIYGGKATMLTVNCDNYFACDQLEIYCPETSASKCIISCNEMACFGTTIYGDHHNEINIEAAGRWAFESSTVYAYDAMDVDLHCSGLEACYASYVYASKADNINVLCNSIDYTNKNNLPDFFNSSWFNASWYYGGQYYEYENSSPCYGLTIYASSAQNSLLTCKGDYACYTVNLDAENANNVRIISDNGQYGMQQTIIHASNAIYLELNCIGSEHEHGCTQSNIYLPADKSNFVINCYGFGCDDLYLYHSLGFSILSTANTVINSCGICSGLSDCINIWYFDCFNFSPAQFDGLTCLDQLCECSSYAARSDKVFINDLSAKGCAMMGIVPDTTNIPIFTTTTTTVIQQSEQTGDNNTGHESSKTESSSNDNNGNPVMIFIIIASVVIFCCIIGNIIYCYKRKVNEKIAHEILNEAEEGGIDEIALEPMDQNIGQQIGLSTDGKSSNEKNNKKNKRKYVKLDDAGDGATTGGITGITAYGLATNQ
eukprot:93358_1